MHGEFKVPNPRTLHLTNGLRWRNGVLEQAWQCIETGEVEWQPVPIEDE